MWKVVKPGVRAELCCSKEVSHVPEEDEVDHPVVLHGGDVDDEVDGVDPPVGGVDDDGVVIRVEEIVCLSFILKTFVELVENIVGVIARLPMDRSSTYCFDICFLFLFFTTKSFPRYI